VLAEHGCPSDVINHWVQHTEQLKSKIVATQAKCNE
jgi:hypothetical protein